MNTPTGRVPTVPFLLGFGALYAMLACLAELDATGRYGIGILGAVLLAAIAVERRLDRTGPLSAMRGLGLGRPDGRFILVALGLAVLMQGVYPLVGAIAIDSFNLVTISDEARHVCFPHPRRHQPDHPAGGARLPRVHVRTRRPAPPINPALRSTGGRNGEHPGDRPSRDGFARYPRQRRERVTAIVVALMVIGFSTWVLLTLPIQAAAILTVASVAA